MRFEHVVDGGWWLMPGAPDPRIGWPGLKNKKDHRIWLPKAARAVVESQHQGNVTPISGFAFTGAGGRPVDRLDAVMRSICKELGIRDKVTPHDLRRSFLSTVTKLRFSRHLMDLIANHKTKTTTDVYDRHGYSAEVKEAMEATASFIVALARGQESAVVELRHGGVQKTF
jgi:integrase